MSHETKAGLLVSFSFICLVGVVVYVKMTGTVLPGTDSASGMDLPPWPVQPASEGTVVPVEGVKTAPDAKAGTAEPGALNLSSGQEIQPVAGAAPGNAGGSRAAIDGPLVSSTPSPVGRDVPPAGNPLGASAVRTASDGPAAPGTRGSRDAGPDPFAADNSVRNPPAPADHGPTMPAASDRGPRDTGPRVGLDGPLPSGRDTPERATTTGRDSQPSPTTPEPRAQPAPLSGSPLGGSSERSPLALPTGRETNPTPSGTPPASSGPPISGAGPTPGTNPPSDSGNPLAGARTFPDPVAPVGPTGDRPSGSSGDSTPDLRSPNRNAAIGDNPSSGTAGSTNSTPPAPAGIAPRSDVPAGEPPTNNQIPPLRPEATPDRSAGTPTDLGSASAVTMPRNPDVVVQGPGSTPPLAAPPVAVSPPITVPVPGNPAPGAAALSVPPAGANDSRVISFDEETYICKPNDTLAGICRERYHSEQYVQALTLFNRSHPMAAAGIRSDPPVLQAGQPVYIPPAEILQKRCPAGANGGPINPPTSFPSGPQGGTMPTPTAPSNPQVGLIPPTPPGPTTGVPAARGREWLYTVQSKPETFYEIAKRELGNGDRWSDIWRLNQSFAAGDSLLVGTVLRMPPQ